MAVSRSRRKDCKGLPRPTLARSPLRSRQVIKELSKDGLSALQRVALSRAWETAQADTAEILTHEVRAWPCCPLQTLILLCLNTLTIRITNADPPDYAVFGLFQLVSTEPGFALHETIPVTHADVLRLRAEMPDLDAFNARLDDVVRELVIGGYWEVGE